MLIKNGFFIVKVSVNSFYYLNGNLAGVVICEDKFILSFSSSTQQNTLSLLIHLFLDSTEQTQSSKKVMKRKKTLNINVSSRIETEPRVAREEIYRRINASHP